FFIFGISAVYTLIQTTQGNLIGDDSGAMRLGIVIGMALLPMILYREIVASLNDEIIKSQTSSAITPPPPPSVPMETPSLSPAG
ncbi:MAG TPA: hypothetical protein PLZ51_23355, partial [Aggregatilineales bacterium]|nr:hypothetical protein [Aggregatilineales bacterium]